MRRKARLSVPPEPPDWYGSFDAAMWARPEDLDGGDDIWMADYAARSRWVEACQEWCREHGVSVLAELRARRAQQGYVHMRE